MLKEQHMPWSVGKLENIAEHGTSKPFHWQNLNRDGSCPCPTLLPCKLKQGVPVCYIDEKIFM
jgi:hypothetical protein